MRAQDANLPERTASPMAGPAEPAHGNLAIAGAIGVGLLGIFLYAAAIVLHPGWVVPLAETGVVAVFAALFAATR
jgi:hypothetical protein